MSIDRLSVEIENKTILQDICLTIQETDFITLIGPNGAGKTTLINCLIGTRAYQGNISKRSQLRIGHVPQKFAISRHIPMSVEHFLNLNRGDHAAIATKAHLTLSDLEIRQLTQVDPLLKQPLHDLSGGQLQIAILTRALLLRPDLLILDEPAKSMDVNAQLHFYQLLKKLNDQFQIAILLVSHDLHFVMQQSKKIICLNRHICCSGGPSEITHNASFQSIFGHYQTAGLGLYEHDLHHHRCDHDGIH